jgi:hypothetical protein
VARDCNLHLSRERPQRHDCYVDRDGGEPEGWRGGVARCTLIKEEAGEAAERGNSRSQTMGVRPGFVHTGMPGLEQASDASAPRSSLLVSE